MEEGGPGLMSEEDDKDVWMITSNITNVENCTL